MSRSNVMPALNIASPLIAPSILFTIFLSINHGLYLLSRFGSIREVDAQLIEQYITMDAEFAELSRELGSVREQKMESQGKICQF